MIWSSDRKKVLSGWLLNNDYTSFNTPLKLQKYLFFYESLSKVHNDNPEFAKLKGYIHGPVFSNVWGDYTKERYDFELAVDKAYKEHKVAIVSNRAKLSDFIVKTCTEAELSSITHNMDIWKSKKVRIESGEQQVPLDESDFSERDANIMSQLEYIYPTSTIDNSDIIQSGNKIFIISKMDYKRMTAQQMNTLQSLSSEESINNPVYVRISDGGTLLID